MGPGTAALPESRELSGERVIRLPSLMPHTHEIYLDPSRFKVVICGRRWAKTHLARAMAIVGHGPAANGAHRRRKGALSGGLVWWVVPTHPSARSTWDAFEYALRDVWVGKNATEKFFDLPGGGRLQIKSGDEPESLRGDGLDGVVIEEVKDQKLKLWKQVLRPALGDKLGWMVAIGTPGAPDELNLAYHLFQQAGTNEGGEWRRWQEPSSRNPILTPKEIASMREECGTVIATREIDAQFVALGAGDMFRRDWVKWYKPGAHGLIMGNSVIPISILRRFGTVDLAATVKTYSDYSVIGSFGVTPSGELVGLDMLREKLPPHAILPAIRDAVKTWGLGSVFVESTAYNNLWAALAAVELPLLQPLMVDKDKVTRARPASVMMQAGRIWLPESTPERPIKWVEELMNELCSFPDPEASDHDDTVDVFSSAVRVAALLGPEAGRQEVAQQGDPTQGFDPWNPQRNQQLGGDSDGFGEGFAY